VVALGQAGVRRLDAMRGAGVRACQIDGTELAERLPLLAPPEARAVFDEDGGVIRARASIEALTDALRERFVFDEVLSVRVTAAGTVEVRAGGITAEHDRVVVCAGRGTAALARGAGLPLPLRHAAHVRLTFAVKDDPPPHVACLLDSSRASGEVVAYGDPLPGNSSYAVGLDDTPVHDDGSLIDAGGLASIAGRTTEYVARALPGLDPQPIDVRHCWVTELPWHPDGFAVWELGGLLILAGNHLFKHAPALGRALARAAVGDGLAPILHPEARLGAELFEPSRP
jgi:sarcosine oxidase